MTKPTAEQCLLGSMILDGDCIGEVLKIVAGVVVVGID